MNRRLLLGASSNCACSPCGRRLDGCNDLIWHKKDPAPESPRDRWRSGHEHVFFLTKRPKGYRFDADAIRVPHASATMRCWGGGQVYDGPKSRDRGSELDSRMRHGKSFRLNPKGCLPIDVRSSAPRQYHRATLRHLSRIPCGADCACMQSSGRSGARSVRWIGNDMRRCGPPGPAVSRNRIESGIRSDRHISGTKMLAG